MKRSALKRGFTLVELVIVILVLGILAAIAVPKLFNTSATAVDNSLKQTLGTVRDAIEMYAGDNAELPGQSSNLAADLAPYLRGEFPKCSVGDATTADAIRYSTGAGAISGEASPAEGWHYNSDTGEFIVNFSGPSKVDPTVNYDEF